MTVRSTSCWRQILQWSPSTNSTPSSSMACLGVDEGDGEDESSFTRFEGLGRVGLGDFIHNESHGGKNNEYFWRLDKIGLHVVCSPENYPIG